MGTEAAALLLGAVAVLTGLILLAGGLTKLAHRREFRGVVHAYRLLPEPLVAPVAALLPPLEVVLGVLVLSGAGEPFAGVAAAVLFAVFGMAIGVNLHRGRRHIDCGCFQSALRHPLHRWLVARCAVLALLSLAVANGPRAPLTIDTLITIAPAGIALFFIHLALDHVWALGESRRKALGGLPT